VAVQAYQGRMLPITPLYAGDGLSGDLATLGLDSLG